MSRVVKERGRPTRTSRFHVAARGTNPITAVMGLSRGNSALPYTHEIPWAVPQIGHGPGVYWPFLATWAPKSLGKQSP